MRIICIDYGRFNIGTAISDESLTIARPLQLIQRKSDNSFKQIIGILKGLMLEFGVTDIVIGYPLNMDGTEGKACEYVKDFKDRLKRNIKNINVMLHDERLSTVIVQRLLKSDGIDIKNQRKYIDVQSAVVILQSYLDRVRGDNL